MLPFQVPVVLSLLNIGVISVICLVFRVRTRCEHKPVGIVVGRIQHLKRRQLNALAITSVNGQRKVTILDDVITSVDTRRQT